MNLQAIKIIVDTREFDGQLAKLRERRPAGETVKFPDLGRLGPAATGIAAAAAAAMLPCLGVVFERETRMRGFTPMTITLQKREIE